MILLSDFVISRGMIERKFFVFVSFSSFCRFSFLSIFLSLLRLSSGVVRVVLVVSGFSELAFKSFHAFGASVFLSCRRWNFRSAVLRKTCNLARFDRVAQNFSVAATIRNLDSYWKYSASYRKHLPLHGETRWLRKIPGETGKRQKRRLFSESYFP